MNTSPQGRADITQREGVRHWSYRDIRGIWTIGVGHTGPEVREGLYWTEAQVDAALEADLGRFEEAVNSLSLQLTQSEFDALVSLAFNIGVNGFLGSSVVKMLKIGDINAAADDFLMWEKPPELRARREGERAQFLGLRP